MRVRLMQDLEMGKWQRNFIKWMLELSMVKCAAFSSSVSENKDLVIEDTSEAKEDPSIELCSSGR